MRRGRRGATGGLGPGRPPRGRREPRTPSTCTWFQILDRQTFDDDEYLLSKKVMRPFEVVARARG